MTTLTDFLLAAISQDEVMARERTGVVMDEQSTASEGSRTVANGAGMAPTEWRP